MNKCLDGVLVLDLSRVLAGPYCTMQLADMGAEVIKVENPDGGDETRQWGPPFGGDGGASAYFESVNRGKKSAAINFSKPRGAALVRDLAKKADVLVENFLPGALEKYGLGCDSLREANPDLIICSITGYGQDGEWSGRPGYDFIIQGESGLMALGGEPGGPPYKTGVAVCDVLAGLNAAQAILAALLRRARGGGGARIDISLFDCAVCALVNVAQAALQTGKPAARCGNDHPHIVPYGAFRAADGDFNLAAGNDRQFAALADILDQPDWARGEFATNPGRVRGRERLLDMLNREFARKPKAHWLRACRERSIPAGETLNVIDALALPHVASRGLATDGARRLNSPLRFEGEAQHESAPPPRLGADTDAVLHDLLGFSASEMRTLRAEGAAGAVS